MILRWIHIFLFLNALALIRSQQQDSGGGVSEETDDTAHFSDVGKGRMAWIVEDHATPWIGSYHFLGSSISHSTALLLVFDSSTGKKLAECSTTTNDPASAENAEWHKFVWTLNKNSLECNISTSEPYVVNIEPSPHPRSFSIRILAVKGPRCFRDLIVQNEQPNGCPPVLRRNTFAASNFECGCPKSIIERWTAVSTTPESTGQLVAAAAALSASSEGNSQVPLDANGVQFPLFQLGENETEITRVYPVGVEKVVAAGVTQATPINPPAGFTFKANACFGFDCHNNGTCVLDTRSQPSCLCNEGFAGDHCEIDLCAQTTCQNGGFCQIQNGVPICQCPAGTLGANCETVVCPNDCENEGMCMFVNNIPMCHCKDGFIGPNCNVKDHCKNATTCAVFGSDATCVTDASSYGTISTTLVDANYSCQCLDDNNQMADCLALALARQSVTTRRPSTSTPVPTTESFVVAETTDITENQTEEPVKDTTPIFIPPVGPEEESGDKQSFVRGQGSEDETPVTKEVETENATQEPVFPAAGFTTSAQTEVDEEDTEEPVVITTPPSVILPEVTTEATVSEETEEESEAIRTTPDLFTILSSTRAVPTVPIVITTEEPEEPTTLVTNPPTTAKPEIPAGAGDEDEIEGDNGFEMVTQIAGETTTPHGSLWTIPESVEIDNGHVPTSNTVEEHRPDENGHEEHVPHVHPSPTDTNENVVEEGATEDKDPEDNRTNTGENPEPASKASSKGATWVSWVIAIIAIIVLIALIIAGVMFILRYIRRSRRLHGKYNPAREENAVASTYAMPMTTVSKQERLI